MIIFIVGFGFIREKINVDDAFGLGMLFCIFLAYGMLNIKN